LILKSDTCNFLYVYIINYVPVCSDTNLSTDVAKHSNINIIFKRINLVKYFLSNKIIFHKTIIQQILEVANSELSSYWLMYDVKIVQKQVLIIF